MRENRYRPCGGKEKAVIKKKKWGASLQRFSFSFSGIDFVEDVFVTSPDD